MTRCRKAIDQRNWVELVSIVHNIASKARRVSDVAKTRAAGITDLQTKIRVRESVKILEIGMCIDVPIYYCSLICNRSSNDA